MQWFKVVLVIVLSSIVIVNLLALMHKDDMRINRSGMGIQIIALSLCLIGIFVFM